MRRSIRYLQFVLILALASCGAARPADNQPAHQAPSVAPVFLAHEAPTTRPLPTSAPPLAITTRAPAPADNLTSMLVFDDALAAGWSLDASERATVDIADSRYVHSGRRSIRLTPTGAFGRLFFTVAKGSRAAFERADITAVSLWLYTGDGAVGPSDLAITIIGSNDYTYYVPDDDSVITNEERFFSETRLYYLGITRDLPPDTWVEVLIWLDDLPYEPDYTYITGIYLKNDQAFRQTVYIDDVALLAAPKE